MLEKEYKSAGKPKIHGYCVTAVSIKTKSVPKLYQTLNVLLA